jgi:hypothetical protein
VKLIPGLCGIPGRDKIPGIQATSASHGGSGGDQPRRLTSGGPTDLIWAQSFGLKGRHSTYAPHMTIQRMEHVGIVVDDLAAATEFFVELGLVLQGEWSVEGRWVDRIVGLEGVRADAAMMQTPDGNGGNHHRASGADRLTGRVRRRPSEVRSVRSRHGRKNRRQA